MERIEVSSAPRDPSIRHAAGSGGARAAATAIEGCAYSLRIDQLQQPQCGSNGRSSYEWDEVRVPVRGTSVQVPIKIEESGTDGTGYGRIQKKVPVKSPN